MATYPPNVRWVELFKYLQSQARDAKRGLWADTRQSADPIPTSPPAQKVSPTPTPSTAPAGNVTYNNCTEVKAAGKAPLYKTDPGYSNKLDRD
jgi:micrococcal nuclease